MIRIVKAQAQHVIGAGGGGMIEQETGEVFMLYLNPGRRHEGIGSMLLEAITRQQKENYGAKEQWVLLKCC